ncbi:hypothetical protein SSCH_2960001 [Syntrophaceticus schinkii]|uniref:Transposase-like Mu C-terminal domain-containing protein n=2 Tax=Syntrophaceticus schinkii TaxID=499207 RepID=A0A0B7MMG4_9FIRM|nr:hypothetical protein SSCH_2960001 [Syntrophaceticus schinkii]
MAGWLLPYPQAWWHRSDSACQGNCKQTHNERVPISELTDIFLWEENRKVDKTGCVHVFGNIYEVPCELSGEKVKLRFDPFDLSVIQVWFDGKRFPDAIPLDLHRSVHKRVKTKPSESIQEIEPSPGEVNTGESEFFSFG